MKKILFIDDNTALREVTLEALQLEGFDALGAENGKQGILMAKEQIPDLILCDIMMPETDGYEVYKQLKSDSSTSLIPFIFLTALSERDDVRKGMNLGADDYVTKPIALSELLETIYTRLEKAGNIDNQLKSRMNELKDRIIHTLPHELLTPLNSIIGFAELLREEAGNLSRYEISEMASAIEVSGNRLQDSVNNYLNYVVATARNEPRGEVSTLNNISDRMREISMHVAEKYKRANDLILSLDDASLMMEFDDFDFVIKELVDNAFKFSEPKSNVIVASSVCNCLMEIGITDNGVGFPLECMEDIGAFNQFNRKKMEQQGSGLGLITSMLIVQRYKGTVKITNNKFGSTVLLTLPVAHNQR